MSARRRSIIWGLTQSLLAILLLGWLLGNMENRHDLLTTLKTATARPGWLLGAFFGALCCMLLCVWRWTLLLKRLGLPTRYHTALKLFFVGQFFNAFLLGSSGGDLVRATAIAARTPGRRTEAATSVMVDRMLGIMALAFLASAMVVVKWQSLSAFPATRAIAAIAALSAAGGVVLLLVASSKPLARHLTKARLAVPEKGVRATLLRAAQALHTIVRHPATCAAALTLSLFNHVLASVGIWCLARALGLSLGQPAGLLQEIGSYLAVGPLIHLIAAIPLTPSGLGPREAATIALLGLPTYNVPYAMAFSLGLLIFGMATLWSLISGLVYLATRFHPEAADRAPEDVDHAHP